MSFSAPVTKPLIYLKSPLICLVSPLMSVISDLSKEFTLVVYPLKATPDKPKSALKSPLTESTWPDIWPLIVLTSPEDIKWPGLPV